jgi:hypothetical protein
MNSPTHRKTIECLDLKEREFFFYENGKVNYKQVKNGEHFGPWRVLNQTKLPKWITMDMLKK